MPGQCVIGLQWGDEAKGKLVDLLTSRKDIVVRYQGGANAGHTIVVGDDVYKLHHIPSGILAEGVLNLIGPGVVINPATLLQEIESLQSRGIDVSARMKISQRAHLVMPWHLLEDRVWNDLISGEENIGTTLRGIGPCYADKVGRSFAFRVGDLLQPDFAARIHQVAILKQKLLMGLSDNGLSNADRQLLEPSKIVADYQAFAQRLSPMITDTNRILLDAVDQDLSILFEGAQGSLLDIDHGTFPFVTSSNSSGVGISNGSGVPGNWLSEVIGVCKVYTTRVGGGPFPTELHDSTGQRIRDLGHEYGTTTGRPRRCGWFDAVAVRYTARLSGVTSVALTMMDVLSHLEEVKICVGYQLRDQQIDYFPAHVNDLRELQPIYETLPGWQHDISQARSLDELPAGAIGYIGRLQAMIGRPVGFISVGPDRAQTIFVKPGQLKSQLEKHTN